MFLDRLSERPLLADGAMGTMIHGQGVDFEQCFDMLSITHPQVLVQIHRMYAEAGADILETNTFGANRYRMDHWGVADQVSAANSHAVQLARQVVRDSALRSGREIFVAASIGPLGVRLAPLGNVRIEDAYAAFVEQITATADAGADVLFFETFSDLQEIEQAIRAARTVCKLPIVAHMTFSREGRTIMGETPDHVATRLREFGADVIGANCSTGPRGVLNAVSAMRERVEHVERDAWSVERDAHALRSTLHPFISAIPNAGFPEQRGGRLLYPATPDYFAGYVPRFLNAGVRLVGGCCGTTPAHTKAMREALDRLSEGRKTWSVGREGLDVEREAWSVERGAWSDVKTTAIERSTAAPTNLAQALAEQRFVVTVEVEPPRRADTVKLEDTARMLREAGATMLDISDMPMARMRMSGLAASHRVQMGAEIETVLHFPVRGRNLLRVQGDLLAAHALNIRNLFVTMGDPSSIGDYPQAFDHHDIVPTGLVQLIKEKFNQGQDSAGQSIGSACSFVVGVAANLTPGDFDKEAKLLKKKIDCGADFALTQPVFDVETALKFIAHYERHFGKLSLPILIGILPLASARHAEFLRNEVPGMMLPDGLVQRMTNAGSNARAEGTAIAADILREIRPSVQGVYFIPAFKRYDIVAGLIENL